MADLTRCSATVSYTHLQVPDTRNVGKDAMKADGTINRAALPAIFNPEDPVSYTHL